LIFILLFPVISIAAPLWVKCPYEQTEDGSWVVTIDRLTADICSDRGVACRGISEGWAEQQVASEGGVPQAIVFTDVSPALRSQILNPTQGGCSVLTKADLDTDLARNEAARTILTQHRDSNGKAISPITSSTLVNLQNRSNGVRPAQTTWQQFKNFWVGVAYALGTFPDSTVLIDDFNRSDEDPLSGGGNWTSFHIDATSGVLKVISNEVARSTLSNGSSAYTALQCPADCDAYVTLVVVGTSRVFVRLNDLGNNGDGYLSRGISSNNVNVYRVDDGTTTQLGATCSQTVAAEDELGVRAEGTNITSYLNNTAICTRSDATYSAAGYAGIQTSNSGDRLDDFFMTVISSNGGGMPLLWRLLQ